MNFEFSNKNREIEVHNYHESTGEYLSSGMLLIEAHTGLPALAPVEALPFLGQNKIAVFKADKWEVLGDNRGPIWDTVTKELGELAEWGEVPDGKTELEPGSFDSWDGTKWVLDASKKLKDGQLIAIAKVREFATQCRQSIAGNPDHLETAEWSEKRLRALRVIDGVPLARDAEKLETEALYRNKGETPEQLAAIVMEKAKRFEHASIVITGMTAAAIAAVNKTTSADEIEILFETLKDKARTELAKL